MLIVAAAMPGHAQSRKPTAAEVTAVRNCAAKNQDEPDKGEQECLFKLVGDPCIDKLAAAGDAMMADCYYIEDAIWDDLLNENYKKLLAELDPKQTDKAKAMQRDWMAYRDSTCLFYDDKIRGTMAITMRATCITRETARRAMLLYVFSQL
jgi:uncharacterized protein YecT (DUF1311 family)